MYGFLPCRTVSDNCIMLCSVFSWTVSSEEKAQGQTKIMPNTEIPAGSWRILNFGAYQLSAWGRHTDGTTLGSLGNTTEFWSWTSFFAHRTIGCHCFTSRSVYSTLTPVQTIIDERIDGLQTEKSKSTDVLIESIDFIVCGYSWLQVRYSIKSDWFTHILNGFIQLMICSTIADDT